MNAHCPQPIRLKLMSIVFCVVVALPAVVIAAQSKGAGRVDANKQQEMAVIRARIQQYNEELSLNRSAQQRPDISDEQRTELQSREARLGSEIAKLQARLRELQQSG